MFVWSDELALLLRDEGEATTAQLSDWISSPVAYRLRDAEEPIDLARRVLAVQIPERRAS